MSLTGELELNWKSGSKSHLYAAIPSTFPPILQANGGQSFCLLNVAFSIEPNVSPGSGITGQLWRGATVPQTVPFGCIKHSLVVLLATSPRLQNSENYISESPTQCSQPTGKLTYAIRHWIARKCVNCWNMWCNITRILDLGVIQESSFPYSIHTLLWMNYREGSVDISMSCFSHDWKILRKVKTSYEATLYHNPRDYNTKMRLRK